MAKLIECIPNFSCSKEKDEKAYQALVDVANSSRLHPVRRSDRRQP